MGTRLAAIIPIRLCKAIAAGRRKELKKDGVALDGVVGMRDIDQTTTTTTTMTTSTTTTTTTTTTTQIAKQKRDPKGRYRSRSGSQDPRTALNRFGTDRLGLQGRVSWS